MTKQGLKRLVTLPSEIHASAIVNLLEDNGVKAMAVGGFTSGFKAEAPGFVDVMVLQSDWVAASGVLTGLDAADPLAGVVAGGIPDQTEARASAGVDGSVASERRQNLISAIIAGLMLLCLLTLLFGLLL